MNLIEVKSKARKLAAEIEENLEDEDGEDNYPYLNKAFTIGELKLIISALRKYAP